MKKRMMMFSLIAAVLVFASPAMAYTLTVEIDGSAIKPNSQMEVAVIVENNGNLGAIFTPKFNQDGKMTSIDVKYGAAANYPYTPDSSIPSFTVSGLSSPLVTIKVTTPYNTTPEQSYGSSTQNQRIIIHRSSISKF